MRVFFLAIAPGRIPKVLEMLSKLSNSELSRIGLIIMAIGVAILMISGI
ncbi:MAG: DUF2065 family protein [Paracoccaceae bacterium]